jgi:hypothetical protein
MMLKFIKFITITICLFICFKGACSHLLSGQMDYEKLSASTYKVRLQLVMDCNSIPPNGAIVGFSSLSMGSSNTQTIPLIGATEIPLYCGVNNTICTNPSSTNIGFRSCIYEGIIILPFVANDWKVSFADASRSGMIANGFANSNFNVFTTINDSIVNNSPKFGNETLIMALPNQPFFASSNRVDADGDSLTFHLDQPRSLNGPGFLTFPAPYSALNPLPNLKFVLDSVSGELEALPTNNGLFVFTERIEEYRNGKQISKTFRDIAMLVQNPNVPDSLPTCSGVNNSSTYTIAIDACNSWSFTIQSKDGNPADSTFIIPLNIIPGSSISHSGTQNDLATFTWTPTNAQARSQPYFQNIWVKDNQCDPIGQLSFTYLIYVNSCPNAIKDSYKPTFSIHPNPTNQFITISSIIDMDGNTLLTLLNDVGQQVASLPIKKLEQIGRDYRFDMAQYPNGLYHLQINNGKTLEHLRVVKSN